jgi:hypothetical protein
MGPQRRAAATPRALQKKLPAWAELVKADESDIPGNWCWAIEERATKTRVLHFKSIPLAMQKLDDFLDTLESERERICG